MAKKIIIIVGVGERQTTIELEDPRSIGFVTGGIGREVDELFDGHGKVINPEAQTIAKDLVKLLNATGSAHNEVLADSAKSQP